MEKLPGDIKIARVSNSIHGGFTLDKENKVVDLKEDEITMLRKVMGSQQKTGGEGEPRHQL